jgi:hypothetical protein
MTVNSATSTASYLGNGATQLFPVPFYFLVDTDLKVSRKLAGTNTSTVLTLNSDYTLSGSGNQLGGSLSMLVAPASNDQLFIERNVAPVQQTAYPENNKFPSASHEKALDRLTMLIQQALSKLTFGLFRDPLGSTYDLAAGTLINSGTATNANDVPSLVQVQGLIVAGAAPSLVGPNGSALVGFLQAGTGAVARTVQDKNRDVFHAKDFGVLADGVTNDRVALLAAMNAASAAKAVLHLPAGTIMVDSIDLPANIALIGETRGRTVIKRTASATQNYIIGAGSRNGVSLENITVDGNRAANTNPAHNILLQGCNEYFLSNVTSKNAKGNGTYGCGIAIVGGTDGANNTFSSIQSCKFTDNDVYGAYVSVTDRFLFNACEFVRNTFDGLSIANGVPPAAPTEKYWAVTNCRMSFNTGSGMGVTGFGNELHNYTSYANVISGNVVHNNTKYGLTYQSSSCSITGNTIVQNGDSDFNGGVLLNAQYVAFTGNTVCDNTQYGIDAGGCLACTIGGNVIRDNVGPSGGGCGINLGASTYTNVTGNTLIGNGGASGGGNIFLHGIDGGTIPVFETLGGQCTISNNLIYLQNNNQYGIAVDKGDVRGVTVRGNSVYGGVSQRAYSYQSRFLVGQGNLHYPDSTAPFPAVSYAPSLIIPDDGTDIIDISGTGTVSEILTQSQSDFKNKVRAVYIIAGGSGYTSAPAVSFSGGGGSGAAGTAYVVNGAVRAVVITNPGAGYTSAPSMTLTGGGGSGANWTVLTECPNNYGRTIRLHANTAGLAVSSTNNIRLSGGASWTSNAQNMLTLVGLYSGAWYEQSRS